MQYLSIRVRMLVIILNIIFIPALHTYKKDEANLFHVFLNGSDMGHASDMDVVQELLSDARRELGRESGDVVYVDADLTYEASSVVFGRVDSDNDIKERMMENLKACSKRVLVHAYTMRIGDYSVNLGSLDDIKEVLQAALELYDLDNSYAVQVISDPERELSSLTVAVVKTEVAQEEDMEEPVRNAGFASFMEEAMEETEIVSTALDFDDYEYGILSMAFDDDIEIVEGYLTENQIASVSDAVKKIVNLEEKKTIYEVQTGDTLSEIALKTSIPMDKIVELNENLENENSMIRAGDELVVTTTEPPITIERMTQEYIEEIYDAEIQYVENDNWYTTEQVTLQQPSAGRRNIVAQLTYANDKEIGREIIKEEVLLEAVPKIVERGTKIPPTYIKPLSGGRMSSGFGRRNAPTRGASTNHQGVDWATPVGTAIYASSGGVVTRAGWGSGYGYCVYIRHPDGKETRYGHLSKVLVSSGQSVKQGQKIALSGNTGRSTGPHLHFEIRINGVAVNPLKYLN